MTANRYYSSRHKYFPTRVDKGERRERSPLGWPNYTENDIEECITCTGCVWPDRACEICGNSRCCPLPPKRKLLQTFLKCQCQYQTADKLLLKSSGLILRKLNCVEKGKGRRMLNNAFSFN